MNYDDMTTICDYIERTSDLDFDAKLELQDACARVEKRIQRLEETVGKLSQLMEADHG